MNYYENSSNFLNSYNEHQKKVKNIIKGLSENRILHWYCMVSRKILSTKKNYIKLKLFTVGIRKINQAIKYDI